ncbi:hypothetical protein [Vulgatibacter incomptus]|uniref:Uncharacterized protein n=1 Tax=Vulgatibacter incomptus TaxID=1391653 RepID=A0A0K1PCG3_9BACT|nr:hypothetical protein [Vulgatibacter incomptus]AKU91213.1 hypothetical protein AKJ08_1600 [Vulgatibacter incomptus]
MNDDFDDEGSSRGGDSRFFEFDCPDCDANNPIGDGFRHGEYVQCGYCGVELRARVNGDGRLELRGS